MLAAYAGLHEECSAKGNYHRLKLLLSSAHVSGQTVIPHVGLLLSELESLRSKRALVKRPITAEGEVDLDDIVKAYEIFRPYDFSGENPYVCAAVLPNLHRLFDDDRMSHFLGDAYGACLRERAKKNFQRAGEGRGRPKRASLFQRASMSLRQSITSISDGARESAHFSAYELDWAAVRTVLQSTSDPCHRIRLLVERALQRGFTKLTWLVKRPSRS